MNIKVTTKDTPKVTHHEYAGQGWDHKCRQTEIEGDLGEIEIEIDGTLRYGLQIDKKGNVHLTTFGKPLTQYVPTNLSLRV